MVLFLWTVEPYEGHASFCFADQGHP
jgi:hypothetical protein